MTVAGRLLRRSYGAAERPPYQKTKLKSFGRIRVHRRRSFAIVIPLQFTFSYHALPDAGES